MAACGHQDNGAQRARPERAALWIGHFLRARGEIMGRSRRHLVVVVVEANHGGSREGADGTERPTDAAANIEDLQQSDLEAQYSRHSVYIDANALRLQSCTENRQRKPFARRSCASPAGLAASDARRALCSGLRPSFSARKCSWR